MIFLYKQTCFFIRETDTFGHIVVWTILYTSHRLIYAPTYSFWAIGSMLISLVKVTSWSDIVCNIVTRWMDFSDQFKNIIKRYIKFGYNFDVMRQSAYLVLNPITVYSYGFLSNCTAVGQASMTALT